jgi:hypothetical protein
MLITIFILLAQKILNMDKFHILLDTQNLMMSHFCGLMLLILGQIYFRAKITKVCRQTLWVSLASWSSLFLALTLQRNNCTHLRRLQDMLRCPQLRHLAFILANGPNYQRILWFKETVILKDITFQLMSTGWISFTQSNMITSTSTI